MRNPNPHIFASLHTPFGAHFFFTYSPAVLNALAQGRLKWSPEVKPLAGLGGTQKKRKQYRSISSPHHPQFHTKSHKLKI